MKKDARSPHATTHSTTASAKHADAVLTVEPTVATAAAASATQTAVTNGCATARGTAAATGTTTTRGTAATAATPATGQVATPSTSTASLLTMLFAQANQYVTQASATVAQLQQNLPGLVALPEADRKVTGGRFRDGEAQVLLTVLDECDARPELVISLADLDNGTDPTTFETGLLRSRLELAMALAPLSATLTQLASNLDDTVLYLNDLAKPPTLEAYAILKAVAKTDLSVKTAIAPAVDFYANISKTAAASRKKNAAARLTTQTTQPTAAPAAQATQPAVAAAGVVSPTPLK
jgi:hypothetical protein